MRTDGPFEQEAQPPERFWRNITRSFAYGLVGALVLLLLLVAGGAAGAVVGSVFGLVLFLATVVFLSYRSYRLERAAAGWHRAVVRYQAALMDLVFSAEDRGEVARWLPDFTFFRGPRKLYNVAYSETDAYRMVLFDYTSGARRVGRDGVGCALLVDGLSGGVLTLKPRLFPTLTAPLCGMQFSECPALGRRYYIEAQNEGRARALLGPQVMAAILAWEGPGPPPWICLRDGMLGLSIRRKHAERDKAIRKFYDYALGLRNALSERLREMRSNPPTTPVGAAQQASSR